MKSFFCCFSILLAAFCFSQNSALTYKPFPVYITAGTKVLQKSAFSELNQMSSVDVSGPIQLIGFSIYQPCQYNWNAFTAGVSVLSVVPQKIPLNDSAYTNVSGIQGRINLFGRQIFHSKLVNLYLMIGCNGGFMTLKPESGGSFRNTFVSPKIMLQPGFKIKRLSFYLDAEYEYDVSKTNWKTISSGSLDRSSLPELSQSGLSFFVNLGYMLRVKTDQERRMAKVKKKNKK